MKAKSSLASKKSSVASKESSAVPRTGSPKKIVEDVVKIQKRMEIQDKMISQLREEIRKRERDMKAA